MHPEKIGKYVDVELIGKGGFGAVYKARDPTMDRLVAIKVCSSDEEEIRTRFLREAKIAGGLNHPNITMVFDFGLDEDQPYLVQELLSGENLERVIDLRQPVPPKKKLEMLLQVAHGLQHAQSQGVLHRDVKPANIQILDDDRVKIMDFGMAKLTSSSETKLTEVGSVMGTPGYFAPEQLRAEELDNRVDVFSFGVLAYELLTYNKAFGGDTFLLVFRQVLSEEPDAIEKHWPECPPSVRELVTQCMAKERSDRPTSFIEVEERLRKILDSPPYGSSGSFPAPPELESDATIVQPMEIPTDRTIVLPSAPHAPSPTPPASPAANPSTEPVTEPSTPLPPPEPPKPEPSKPIPAASAPSTAAPSEPKPASPDPAVAKRRERSKEEEVPVTPAEGAGPKRAASGSAATKPAPGTAPPAGNPLTGKPLWIAGGALIVLGLVLLGGEEAVEEPVPEAAPATTVAPTAVGSPTEETPQLPAVFVDASPWAEVVRITDSTGAELPLPAERETPLALRLAPGTYEIYLQPADGGEAEPCLVDTSTEPIAPCTLVATDTTVEEFFGELGWWN